MKINKKNNNISKISNNKIINLKKIKNRRKSPKISKTNNLIKINHQFEFFLKKKRKTTKLLIQFVKFVKKLLHGITQLQVYKNIFY